jgi:hypothetical protein
MVQEEKYSYIYAAIMETGQIKTYLTGRFPTTSLSGNMYILILYDYDSNSVLSAPMKNRGYKKMVCAFDLRIQSLIIHGLQPSLQRLDNEAYLAFVTYLTKQTNKQTTNLHLRTFTVATMLSVQFKLSKTISLQESVQWIPVFLSNCGINSYLRQT